MEASYLSYFLDESTPAYGGKENMVQLKKIRSIGNGDTSNNSQFTFPGHIGTHIDFPFHFDVNGRQMQDYPASFWIFNKIGFIECEIASVEREILKLPLDIEILILKTGFGRIRGTSEYWAEQPVVPARFADLFRQRFPELRVFGFDLISLTSKKDRAEGKLAHHRFLLEKDILVLEDMNLEKLFHTPQKILIAPLLMNGADGVPCTAISY